MYRFDCVCSNLVENAQMNYNPRRPTNITTELARQRNLEAAERTLCSWIQSCLGIIGFGFGLDSISTALSQAFPQKNWRFNLLLGHIIGLLAIALGILLLVLMMVAYQASVKSLDQPDYLKHPSRIINLGIIVSSLIVYGTIALIAALFYIR